MRAPEFRPPNVMETICLAGIALLLPFALLCVGQWIVYVPPLPAPSPIAAAVVKPSPSPTLALVRPSPSAASRAVVRLPLGPSANDFYRLRVCESSDNYRDNTGNGFYGAYQFDLSTWRSNGGTGRPDLASPAEQDRMARLLQSRRGWQPWPDCSRRLGLGR